MGGIGDTKCGVSKRANVVVSSLQNGYCADLEVIIIPKITSEIPAIHLNASDWPIPKNIGLADPQFNVPAKIEMLIGAELFCELLSIGQIKMDDKLPFLQNSVFGWIVMGKVANVKINAAFCGVVINGESGLENCLQKFWSMEEVAKNEPAYTKTEKALERYFIETMERDSSGRFVVRLPFYTNLEKIGQTKLMAQRRFFAVERRLAMIPEIQNQYAEFMEEYIRLGHMERIDEADIGEPNAFLPHHCIVRPEKATTKLRVVFDASAKSNNDVSLNDMMAVGPKLQDDLFDIMLRFRKYKYVMTADIEKMYRQTLVHPDDRNMQMIVWRFKNTDSLQYYRLKTVTYGTKSASYLATRCLKEAAIINEKEFPLASSAISNDFYMDDIITGCNDIGAAITLHYQLEKIMAEFGFNLRKWCSNYAEIIFNEPTEESMLNFKINEETQDYVKTLGVYWLSSSDTFHFKVKEFSSTKITKRIVVSEAAQLFDPLGLVNPVIVVAKTFMQSLWRLKLDWDEALPMELHGRWMHFRRQLVKLNSLSIPRYVTKRRYRSRQLHAFADASEKAYGAVIYMRTVDMNGLIHVELCCSKSRVAPLDSTTIPRLELNAALLMAELVNRVKKGLDIDSKNIFYWSDSQCVLSWLRSESSSFKIYVANRVSGIQALADTNHWRYVNTSENPADVLFRGCLPDGLNKMWFNGPEFLKESDESWKNEYVIPFFEYSDIEEKKKVSLIVTDDNHFVDTIQHKNSFAFLNRIVGWVVRFTGGRNAIKYSELTVKELHDAVMVIFKRMQRLHFSTEIDQLRRKLNISRQSKLVKSNPFLDENGVLRVGGRTDKSVRTYDERHPIILPGKHEFAWLMVQQIHMDNLHAGPQALLFIICQNYWIIGGAKLVRQVIHKCMLCARAKPKIMSQIMGNLPAERVRPSRPFSNVGVDYAGPITIYHRIRGKVPTKSYMCVFVCFTTKAIHLEVASDMTTDAFMGCLKRFIGRRGRPEKIFCDNGTNLVGAKNELEKLYRILTDESSRNDMYKFAANQKIEWKFIPVASPHMGGLWEAAVKSMKYYLKRIING